MALYSQEIEKETLLTSFIAVENEILSVFPKRIDSCYGYIVVFDGLPVHWFGGMAPGTTVFSSCGFGAFVVRIPGKEQDIK